MAERATVRAWKKEGKGYFVSHGRLFQLIVVVVHELRELLGQGNLIPFGKVQNKMLKPKPIHYPIPALGDHRIRWQNSFMIPETAKAAAY